MNINIIKQNYQSVKVLFKIIEAFQKMSTKNEDFINRYQKYYIDRVIATFEDLIKSQYNKKESYNDEILSLTSIIQSKVGYETYERFGCISETIVTNSLKQTFEFSFQAIGEYVYPAVEEYGKIANIQLQSLIGNEREVIKQSIRGFDENLLNEDIWLSLNAIKIILNEKKVNESVYLMANLISMIALQEGFFMINHHSQCKDNVLIEEIISLLKVGLSNFDNLMMLYHKCLSWIRLYNNEKTFQKYEWIEQDFLINAIVFSTETKSQEMDKDDISWDTVIKRLEEK